MSSSRPEIMYLSTSDYLQHKHAPGEPEADAYHEAVDAVVAKLVALGATVAIKATHGITDKSKADGAEVVYLEDELNHVLAPVRTGHSADRDPFVRHQVRSDLCGCFCGSRARSRL